MKEKIRKSRGGAVIYSPFKRIFLVVVIVIFTLILLNSYKLYVAKNNEYNAQLDKIEQLKEQINEEDEKINQLKKREKQATTNEDIEKIARQELGLIKRDEIIIKPR